jgi:hypothetical protein
MGNERITDEVLEIESYINKTWTRVITKTEVPLKDLFPEPRNPGLKHIWKWGAADLVVFACKTPICIIEPGGSHHWEERQMKNDRRKWKLAELNGVNCLFIMNHVVGRLSKRQLRGLLGKNVFVRTIKKETPEERTGEFERDGIK